ncbi:MAG: hypothetical protein N2644_07610, partial [Candidatus Sumerlaea chitinivorans]|nr:hypothetical protein [Candidatus Sumerlaea chitinivorans]
ENRSSIANAARVVAPPASSFDPKVDPVPHTATSNSALYLVLNEQPPRGPRGTTGFLFLPPLLNPHLPARKRRPPFLPRTFRDLSGGVSSALDHRWSLPNRIYQYCQLH